MAKNLINVGLIGLGTVGSGVVKVFQTNIDRIEERVGGKIKIKRVADKFEDKFKELNIKDAKFSTDYNDILNDPEIDIVVELIGGLEPARTICLSAMKKGKHVVTANKAILARYWDEIMRTAQDSKVDIYLEASVGGGIPVIQGLHDGLASNNIQAIYGIVNGTTNYILTRMAEGKDFKESLKETQKKGYAEADSSFDIDGIDSAHKLAILASIAFNTTVDLKDIYTEGIANITHHDFKYAKEEFGQVIKLLAIAKSENGKFEVRVHPTLIPSDHLLAAVDDVYNAIYVIGDIVGPVMFYGQGAGQMAAASAIVSDIVYIARNIYSGVAGKVPSVYYETGHLSAKKIINIEDIKSRYYLRFNVLDQPGVFATISGVLGKYNISIASVYQTERKSGNKVPVIMMTYETLEKDIRIALSEIDNLSITKEKTLLIRVEKGI